MLFNSISFAIFFPVVYLLYYLAGRKGFKVQNILLLAASYFFYACWDWRFLFLLVFSTFLDYYTGLKIHDASSRWNKKIWLTISVTINLGFLAFFKYYNFFIGSFAELLTSFGLQPHFYTLSIILPVGISFYTFHGLSYVFDIYNDKIRPSRDWINYSLFVSFFPLLVAGPIERATHLLPQIERPRTFSYQASVDGLRQILWGLFKKIVIADTCAEHVNTIFGNSSYYSGSTLLIGAVLFAFQIYGDFSGYSDIALGTARMLGFELLQNFRFPYFSRDIAEFWRRWHISLSSWFKDYLYIPLGGSRGTKWQTIRNTFIIFLVSGFWHGANWTFIAWGGLHALFIIPSVFLKTNRNNMEIVAKGKLLPSVSELVHMGITFFLVVIAWIFFRSANISQALSYIAGIFSPSITSPPQVFPIVLFCLIGIFMLIEWIGREEKYAIAGLAVKWPVPIRWALYYAMIFTIFQYSGKQEQFIYFQF